jgi:GTP-binding protein LepA
MQIHETGACARSTASVCSRRRKSCWMQLGPGEMGFITAAIKDSSDTQSRRHHHRRPQTLRRRAARLQALIPMVFCSLFPADASDFEKLKDSLAKLRSTMPRCITKWKAPGARIGFRCGFLGLLHMEIIQERLEREFDLDLIPTAPSVVYKIHRPDGEMIDLYNPSNCPTPRRSSISRSRGSRPRS